MNADPTRWVHLVQWSHDDGRCCEVFEDISLARRYAEKIRGAWITTVSVRGESYVT